jgi:hypothetical protein
MLVERVPVGAPPGAKPRRTSVLAYQVEPPVAPADARVQNRSIRAERGDQTTPAAGCLCVTEVGDPLPLPMVPCISAASLGVRPLAPSRVEVAFEAPAPRAFAYDVRVALAPIATDADFARAMPLPGAPTPAAPGEREVMTVSGLEPGKRYSIAVRAEDAAGKRAPLAVSAPFVTPDR